MQNSLATISADKQSINLSTLTFSPTDGKPQLGANPPKIRVISPQINDATAPSGEITSIQWNKTGQYLLITTSVPSAYIYKLSSGSLIKIKLPSVDLSGCRADKSTQSLLSSFSSLNGRFIIFASSGGAMFQYDVLLQKWESLIKEPPRASKAHLLFISVSCDYGTVAAMSSDGMLILLDLKSKQRSECAIDPSSAIPTDFSFSSFHSSLLAVAYNDGSITLVTTSQTTATVLKRIDHAHASRVTSLEFSPINKYLMISTGEDGYFCLFDVDKYCLIRRVGVGVGLAGISFNSMPSISAGTSGRNTGSLIAFGTSSGNVMCFDLMNGDLKTPCGVFEVTCTSGYLAFSNQKACVGAATIPGDAPKVSTVTSTKDAKAEHKITVQSTPQQLSTQPTSASTIGTSIMQTFSPVSRRPKKPLTRINPVLSMQVSATPSAPSVKSSEQPCNTIATLSGQNEKNEGKVAVAIAKNTPKSILKRSPIRESEKEVYDATQVKQPLEPKHSPTKQPSPVAEISTMVQNKLDQVESDLSEQLQQKLTKADTQDKARQFTTSVITSLISDAMQEVKQELRGDIRAMHLDIMRQFELQRVDYALLKEAVFSVAGVQSIAQSDFTCDVADEDLFRWREILEHPE